MLESSSLMKKLNIKIYYLGKLGLGLLSERLEYFSLVILFVKL